LTEDPKGLGAGLNLYSYVDNDPIRMIDPRGLNGEANRDPNSLLASCYAVALVAYLAAGGTGNQKAVDILKLLSPIGGLGALYSAFKGGIAGATDVSVYRSFNNGQIFVKWGEEARLVSAARGAGEAVVGNGVGILGKASITAAVMGTLVIVGDTVFGREAFLRKAIDECNCGVPDATEKVSPRVLQIPILTTSNEAAVTQYILKHVVSASH
jgi:hypothetical protein